MSLLRSLILMLALVVGQAHACAGIFVCADGEVCTACGTSVEPESDDICLDLGQTCGNCCSVTTCADDSATDEGTFLLAPYELGLPIAFVEFRLALPAEQAPLHPYSAYVPTRAPPSGTGLRAPPSITA